MGEKEINTIDDLIDASCDLLKAIGEFVRTNDGKELSEEKNPEEYEVLKTNMHETDRLHAASGQFGLHLILGCRIQSIEKGVWAPPEVRKQEVDERFSDFLEDIKLTKIAAYAERFQQAYEGTLISEEQSSEALRSTISALKDIMDNHNITLEIRDGGTDPNNVVIQCDGNNKTAFMSKFRELLASKNIQNIGVMDFGMITLDLQKEGHQAIYDAFKAVAAEKGETKGNDGRTA